MKFWLLSIGLIFHTSCKKQNNRVEKYIVDTYQFNTKEMDIQYAYTILYVKDVPRTIEFYKKAFGFEQKLLSPENDYGEIKSGTTTIAFADLELGEANFKKGLIQSQLDKKPFGIELAFTTFHVEKVMENAISNGAVLLEETVTKPWGQKVGYLRDLNGFIVEICTPIQSQE